MLKKNYKGRCTKRSLSKCNEVCKTYSEIQYAYADVLQVNDDIIEIKCNIPLDNEDYTTDFVCIKKDSFDIISHSSLFKISILKEPHGS